MKISFTSCVKILPIKKSSFLTSTERYTTVEFGLCESIIVIDGNNSTCDKCLSTLNIDQLVKLNVESLKISDGSDIWEKKQVTIDSLQIFTSVSIPYKSHISEQWFNDNSINMEEDQFYRICIWYELIKILTGNQIFCFQCDNVIEYSDFVCHYNINSSDNIDNSLSFTLELHSNTDIIRNLAQFTLKIVQNGEIDLFLLSSRMFENLKTSNSMIKGLLQENKSLREQIDKSINERKQLDALLEKRDKVTKAMMINLLNEKKSKIKELGSKLSSLQTNQVTDSDLINNYVHSPIVQLNSPGRRKRKFYADLKSPIPSIRRKNSVKIKSDGPSLTNIKNSPTNIPSLESRNDNNVKTKLKTAANDDTFDGFNNSKFLGINKTINFDNLDLVEPEIEIPKLRIKDQTKKYNNEENLIYRKAKNDDTSLLYELIKKEDFNKTFDNYIDQGEDDFTSNYPRDNCEEINLTTIEGSKNINNNERGKNSDETNRALKKNTLGTETISETDISTDIETDTD
ncbi:Lif1p PWA37_002079 [Arxiozyma heterogenica]|uniref:Uncharacterized protein n=1 Tax=Arxiozyma heterogenica TaxID=278026 RepID=A0AAN7WNC7_9SACH|nr:hypothetical protein RI543_001543 [Kazachstania heterogenica]